jgi:methyltransferase family protein
MNFLTFITLKNCMPIILNLYSMNDITPYSGTSFPFGKHETVEFIARRLPDKNSKILDVGPGRGIYNRLLKAMGYKYFDAVETYLPYIRSFKLESMYDSVYNRNIIDFEYRHYDLVIMGDVVEHLHIGDAQKVVAYAQTHSHLVVIAVPYLLPQKGSQLDGSGDHRQPDLTRDIFFVRYPGFELLLDNHQLGVFYYSQKK